MDFVESRDCLNGVCKQTSGYIRSNIDPGNNASVELFAFVGEKPVSKIAESDKVFVGSSAGKIDSGKQSIHYSTTESIKFDVDDGDAIDLRYIFLKGKAEPGTPFYDKVNNVVVRRNEKYIVRDKFYTSGNIL